MPRVLVPGVLQIGLTPFPLANIRIIRYSGTAVNRIRECLQMNDNPAPAAHRCRMRLGHAPCMQTAHSFHVTHPPKPRRKNRSELRSSRRLHLSPLDVPAGHLPADASAKTGEVCSSACAAAGCRPQHHSSLGMGSIERICISGCWSSGARVGWKPAPTIRYWQSLRLCVFAPLRFASRTRAVVPLQEAAFLAWHGSIARFCLAAGLQPRHRPSPVCRNPPCNILETPHSIACPAPAIVLG